jgi:3-hydroxyacyl-CoA dehydrogenase
LGDGVQAVCFTTKMGTINPALVAELSDWVDGHDRFVLASEARHFSLGFDLTWFIAQIEAEAWDAVDQALAALQALAVKLSTKACVAAIHGYSLGAGMELAFQCPKVVVLADAMLGFPESKVGLFPGGGGTAELALRSQGGGTKAVVDMAIRLANGEVSSNADQARQMGYLRRSDNTVYHPERLITEAKEAVADVSPLLRIGWQVPEGPLSGMIDRELDALVAKGSLTEYDHQIGDRIKHVFTKPTSFEDALAKERSLFVELCQKALTQARIRHMIETNKPLRN